MATILVLGAGGFIGGAIAANLRAAGHAIRHPHLDFAHLTRPADWQPHLDGVDAVINAVGVLRDSNRRPMQAVHADAPAALFEAAAGRCRVIHVSALGIAGNPTRYAQTKLAAERSLQALHGRLDACIVRPSIVFGPGGASSRLFTTLARLPLLALPAAALRTRVQPIAVRDLAAACTALVAAPSLPRQLDAVGPEALTLAAFIAAL
uniref:NAD-dependent epimerase/dehydratase family protein n=1 Tax=Pelomonas sp. KK5 TaxID=1855730 RepID=UPI00097C472D